MITDKVQAGQSPIIHIEVEEIEPYLEKAKQLGGSIDQPLKEIPNIGWYAHVVDHDRNIIGLFRKPEKS